MTRDEAIRLVERIIKCEGSDAEQDRMLLSLEELFPNSDVSDMIFWEKVDRTAVEIVDEAIRRDLLVRNEW